MGQQSSVFKMIRGSSARFYACPFLSSDFSSCPNLLLPRMVMRVRLFVVVVSLLLYYLNYDFYYRKDKAFFFRGALAVETREVH
jgi:hypothetical protein